MSKWKKGHVQWFDKSSGEGIVVGEDGTSYYVHYSTIDSKSDRTQTIGKQAKRRDLDAGKAVKFQIYENLYSKSIEKIEQI